MLSVASSRWESTNAPSLADPAARLVALGDDRVGAGRPRPRAPPRAGSPPRRACSPASRADARPARSARRRRFARTIASRPSSAGAEDALEQLPAVEQGPAAPVPQRAQPAQLREPDLEVDRELEADDAERAGAAGGDRHRGVRRAGRAQHDEFEQAASTPPVRARRSKFSRLARTLAQRTGRSRVEPTLPKGADRIDRLVSDPNLAGYLSQAAGWPSSIGLSGAWRQWPPVLTRTEAHSAYLLLSRCRNSDRSFVHSSGWSGCAIRAACEPLEPPAFDAGGREVGVQAAWGRVAGRPIVCYAQDSSIAGGSVGVAEAEVIVAALRHSRRAGVPLVGFLESAGARLQEGAAALGGFGRIFFENVALSGRSPQISVITGISAGGGCYSPALTDFVVMTEQGLDVPDRPADRQAGARRGRSSAVRSRRRAACTRATACATSSHATTRARRACCASCSATCRRTRTAALPGRAGGAPDRRAILPACSRRRAAATTTCGTLIARLVDGGRFLEVSELWARNMVVGFARLEGHAVGDRRQPGSLPRRHHRRRSVTQGHEVHAHMRRDFGIPMLVARGHARIHAREPSGGGGRDRPRRGAAAGVRRRALAAGDGDPAQGIRRRVHHDELQGSRRGRVVLLAAGGDRHHERARRPSRSSTRRGCSRRGGRRAARPAGPPLRRGEPLAPGRASAAARSTP